MKTCPGSEGVKDRNTQDKWWSEQRRVTEGPHWRVLRWQNDRSSLPNECSNLDACEISELRPG
ncbi:hypothetical protein E2C01_085561 [Portunus trituberculatus]|uniref:Uncharacterized protein n=1 Tax=Portunus trituberculatus TaxID=210409 RepID=A0A5B7JAU2_PORTR|nr:hypothetical protein [Portunus trituberculatus]